MMRQAGMVAGLISALLLSGCNGGESVEDNPGSLTSPNTQGDPDLKQIKSYQTANVIAEKAVECATLYKQKQSCLVEDIQPIGFQLDRDVTIEDIRQRLLVSHQWMGDNFIAVLQRLPAEALNLFKPLNTVVLSYEVRPSFYHGDTSSIYIDPRYLWLNKSQWDDIYQQDDYRKEYASEFLFETPHRYVNSNGDYILYSNYYDAERNPWREVVDIEPGLFRLLAHELAHANDYLSETKLENLDVSKTIWSNINASAPLYWQLFNYWSLNADILHQAAQIAYRGKPMTDDVRRLTAEDAGIAFEPDGAADFYAYSKGTEDVAMLFEAAMMKLQYGAVLDVATVPTPESSSPDCDEYIIKWGQRDRLSDPSVKARAKFVVERMLGSQYADQLDSLPSYFADLPYGVGWCEARTTGARSRGLSVNAIPYDFRDDFIRD